MPLVISTFTENGHYFLVAQVAQVAVAQLDNGMVRKAYKILVVGRHNDCDANGKVQPFP
jgi:hypothetical protein